MPSRNMVIYPNNDPIKKFINNNKKGGKRRTQRKRKAHRKRTCKH